MKVRDKYRDLSRQELLDKAYDLGFNFEKNCGSCSQCTVAAIHELLDIDNVVVKVACSSAGGQCGRVVGTCGGLIGGTMILDYFFGRPVEKMSHQEGHPCNVEIHRDALDISQLLYDKYLKEYGTIICPHIQEQLFGRHFFFLDEGDLEKFDAAGGHSAPDKCSHIVGNAARFTMEILLDKGIIEL